MKRIYLSFGEAKLTPHEAEIVSLVVQGLSRKMIAARLGNSPNTLNHELKMIFVKTQCMSTVMLVIWAFCNGFKTDGTFNAPAVN